MKVSKEIQKKMHKIASLSAQIVQLNIEINNYFVSKGYDMEELRFGDGTTLDELDYGNDITEKFVEDMANGKYTKHQ